MKRRLYYVVEKELQGQDGFEETTGNKLVTVYEVENNEVKKFFELDILNEDNSEESIREYLDDNGYEDEVFDLIRL